MIELLICYAMTVLLTVSLCNTWKNTSFKIHFCKRFFYKDALYHEIETCEDWETYMLMRHGKLGELLVCDICHSHYVALVCSLLCMAFLWTGAVWFSFFCFFTCPWFVSKLVD